MTSRLKKYASLLHIYPTLPRHTKVSLLKHMKKEFVTCICEICLNILKGHVVLGASTKKKLTAHKRLIRMLARKKSINLENKRRRLMTGRGFGLIPLLISSIAPLVSRLIK